MPGRNVVGDYRYNYQGQELDKETGKVAFQLRLYDPRINRWLTTDPKGEFASPYLAMGNNWVRMIDPDGGSTESPDDWVLGEDGKYVWDENVTSATDVDLAGREYIGKNLSDVKSHFIENNSWISRYFGDKQGGFLAHTRVDTYISAKLNPRIELAMQRAKANYSENKGKLNLDISDLLFEPVDFDLNGIQLSGKNPLFIGEYSFDVSINVGGEILKGKGLYTNKNTKVNYIGYQKFYRDYYRDQYENVFLFSNGTTPYNSTSLRIEFDNSTYQKAIHFFK